MGRHTVQAGIGVPEPETRTAQGNDREIGMLKDDGPREMGTSHPGRLANGEPRADPEDTGRDRKSPARATTAVVPSASRLAREIGRIAKPDGHDRPSAGQEDVGRISGGKNRSRGTIPAKKSTEPQRGTSSPQDRLIAGRALLPAHGASLPEIAPDMATGSIPTDRPRSAHAGLIPQSGRHVPATWRECGSETQVPADV